MRIVAGRHRGRRLAPVPGQDLRPTGDRVREALFNLLAHGPYATAEGPAPRGLAVLDAFAGTGALGLEALSRGARRATFLESDRAAVQCIRANVRTLGEEATATVLTADASRPGPAPEPHDLALLDPPYGRGLGPVSLSALARRGWLEPGAVCSLEVGRGESFEPPDGFVVEDDRRYGAARIIILRYRPTQP